MPESPDITVYLECLRPRIEGQVLQQVDLASPFLLRSVDPPVAEFLGQPIRGLRRQGKRIVWCFDGERFLVLHLMIAGRLHWKPPGAKIPGKIGLAAFRFPSGTLTLTEAGSKKRAALYLDRGRAALERHDPGGLDVMAADQVAFSAALTRENHTLKRALTDPRLFDGIGNAYSDEVLHAAGLSPLALTRRLDPTAIARLFQATAPHAHRLDRASAPRGRRRLSGEGDGLPRWDGGPWSVRPTVPGLRCDGAADRLCGERDELLSRLSDERQSPGRPLAEPLAQGRLAAYPGRVGRAAAKLLTDRAHVYLRGGAPPAFANSNGGSSVARSSIVACNRGLFGSA